MMKTTSIQNRRGNLLILTAFLLPVMFLLAAFTINLAYMQLSRTELLVATDAAARSGGRTLSEFQDTQAAKDAAAITAALNNVAGVPLQVDADDQVAFGYAANDQYGVGRFEFVEVNESDVQSGDSLANAVRVNGYRMNDYGGTVQLPFPGFGLEQAWDLQVESVAMQVDRDIALVLDRSGSMDWKTYSWPPGTSPWQTSIYSQAVDEGLLVRNYYGGYSYASGVSTYDYQDWVWSEYYELGDSPNTPWEDLEIAVDTFLQVLEGTVQSERVSLSSYATTASQDLKLTGNYPSVLDKLDQLYPVGSTAIGEGMRKGYPTLFEEGYARPLAAKTMIVMTDGMHNTGVDPVQVASEIVAQYNVTIHSVTFSPGADQVRMQQVADIGGGQHYHADSGEELIAAFREIANNLPTILTK